jgi:hypothetical protein
LHFSPIPDTNFICNNSITGGCFALVGVQGKKSKTFVFLNKAQGKSLHTQGVLDKKIAKKYNFLHVHEFPLFRISLGDTA